MADTPQGLIADSSRQAPDTIRGFVFQLWHSVHAWLELGEGDQLFLEGAEDFDVLSAQGATVNQTRLHQPEFLCDPPPCCKQFAIFWFVRERNRAVRINYRFHYDFSTCTRTWSSVWRHRWPKSMEQVPGGLSLNRANTNISARRKIFRRLARRFC